ncbi:MAG TPA: hypothetical protein VMT53_03710 [Terriglobales bacterium]|nr:hypothetical protein [Terriglobales bacterium]
MPSARKFRRRSPSHREQGYILLTLMFLATLIILSLVALAPQITQQVKRDQEEEMIHRGVQYARAIQHFYKKTGRYPVRLEELDDFNNVRFLRQHYKDPITGKDFKLLHFGDVRMFGQGGIPGATAPNASAFGGGLNPGVTNQNLNNQRFNNFGGANQPGGINQQVQGSNQSTTDEPSNNTGTQPVSQLAGKNDATGDVSSEGANASGTSGNNQVFGGGPIVGVASVSEKKSIREFNKKNHYKDWQFIYDPSSDRGGLLNSPAQPNLNASINASGQGQTASGQPQGSAPQGQQPNSFGQQPGGFGQQGMPMPNQPPDQMEPQEQ